MEARPGPTLACATPVRLAASSSTRMRTSSTSLPSATLIHPTASVASISPLMAAPVGRKFSIKVRTLAFQTWQSPQKIPRFYLPPPGKATVRHGEPDAPIDGPGSGLFRSQDSGQTWSRITGNGLPDGDWGRTAVAISSNGKKVYALISASRKPGLYRSDDAGNTWALQNEDRRLTSRAWYFGNIAVDANNSNVVYVPNVALYRSEDGGKTISIVRGAPGGDDYHHFWIDPTDSSRMILVRPGRHHQRRLRNNLEFLVQPAHRAVLSRGHRQPVSI